MMPETCWESTDNKHPTVASRWSSLSLHNLLTMHGHRNLIVSSSLLMKRTADVVHVIGDVCRHAPLPPKTGVLHCDIPARIPRSAIATGRLTSAACPIYLANEVTARTQTGPLNAGLRLLLPHKNVPIESMMPNCRSLLLDTSFIARALSGERIRLSSLQKWPTTNAVNSLHGCTV
jgi:hypothetical protein